MTTISSITNPPVVPSEWYRMAKHLLFILVLWWQHRSDPWISRKYVNYLIRCLLSCVVCSILLWSISNNSNVINNWRCEVVNTVSIVTNLRCEVVNTISIVTNFCGSIMWKKKGLLLKNEFEDHKVCKNICIKNMHFNKKVWIFLILLFLYISLFGLFILKFIKKIGLEIVCL